MFLFCAWKAYIRIQNQQIYYLHRGKKITVSCQKKFGNYFQVIKVIRLDQCVNHNMQAFLKNLTWSSFNLLPSCLLLSPTNYHDLYLSTIQPSPWILNSLLVTYHTALFAHSRFAAHLQL